MLYYTIHQSFPYRKEEPKGNCIAKGICTFEFLKGFLKDYSYLEFVFQFKGSTSMLI